MEVRKVNGGARLPDTNPRGLETLCSVKVFSDVLPTSKQGNLLTPVKRLEAMLRRRLSYMKETFDTRTLNGGVTGMDCVLCLSLKLPHLRTQSQEFCHLMVNQRSNSVEEYTANRCNKIQCETVQWNADTIRLYKAMQCNTITMQCSAIQ